MQTEALAAPPPTLSDTLLRYPDEKILDRMRALLVHDLALQGVPNNEDVLAMLGEVTDQRPWEVVVTADSPSRVRTMRRRLGLDSLNTFPRVICLPLRLDRTGDGDFFDKAASALRVRPEEILFLGADGTLSHAGPTPLYVFDDGLLPALESLRGY